MRYRGDKGNKGIRYHLIPFAFSLTVSMHIPATTPISSIPLISLISPISPIPPYLPYTPYTPYTPPIPPISTSPLFPLTFEIIL